jgi:hypothetical protein
MESLQPTNRACFICRVAWVALKARSHLLAGLNAAAAHDWASQSRLIWCRWEPSDWASLGVVGSGVMGSDEQAAGAESQTMKAPDNDPAQFDTVFTPGYHVGTRSVQTLGAFCGGGCGRGATLMRVRARTPCSKVFVGGLASETAERDLQVPGFRG